MTRAKLVLLNLVAAVAISSSVASSCNFATRLDEGYIHPDLGHYFDFDHRSSCAGTIVAWHYCYYTSEVTRLLRNYLIPFQIWRERDRYTLQQVHTQHIHLDTSISSNDSFVCQRAEVDDPIPVEVGDFLGVNLPLSLSEPVPVIGDGLQGSTLYINIGDESQALLRRLDGVALHVDAEIVVFAEKVAPSSNTVLSSPQPVFDDMLYTTTVAQSSTHPPLTSSVNSTHQTPSVLPVLSSSTAAEISSSTWQPSVSSQQVIPSTTSSSIRLSVTSSEPMISQSVEGSSDQESMSTSMEMSISISLIPSLTLFPSTTSSSAPFSTSLVDSDKTRVILSRNGFTATPSKPSKEINSAPIDWPFIAGLIVGVILLVLIVMVFILIILVVSVRRGEEPDKIATEAESAGFMSASTHSGVEQRGSLIGHSPSYKIVQVPSLLKSSTVSDESEQAAAPHKVYDAPCKLSPTSVSSACSILFGSDVHHNNNSAQPYETPLVTPLSSRVNLFPSTSTLDTNAGSEVVTSKSQLQPQLNPGPSTMTLDRLRVRKVKRSPKPAPLKLPGKENRKKPPVKKKPKAPTPERTDKARSADDEGYCTVKMKYPVNLLLQEHIDTDMPSPRDMYCTPPDDERDIMETLERMKVPNIPRQDIQVIGHIGNGEFGSVAKAYWKNKSVEIEVAVKSIPSGHTDLEERVKLLQEAVMMVQFRHPNVVQLHGIVTAGTSLMLVLGYLTKGDLRRHLVHMNRRTLLSDTDKLLVSYSQQVALGMHYLASKGFVHRDLAARNIFVSESNTCKVGDFGMSRDLANAPYYISKGGKIPVRWTALEAMYYHKYSSSSDVWSYGCVLYEIWSLGRLPFKKYTNAEVLERLESGYRLPPPPGTPRAIYQLMMQTWHPDPRHRPEFRNILVQLVANEASLLHIPVSDASTSQQASQLGSPLTAGEYMYRDLQRAYIQQKTQAQDKEQYDSLMGRKYVKSFPTSSADIDYLYNDCNMPQRSFRNQLMTSDTESEYEDLSGN